MPSWYSETPQEHEEYLKIFARWQNYAVDGTIFGLSVNPPLGINPNTPVSKLVNKEIIFPDTSVNESIKGLTWISPNRPELTFKERYRRTVAITEEAIKYNWNITNKVIKLNEIATVLQTYINK
jgi:hypothetical protein